MDISEIKVAAEHLAEYIENRGQDANLDVVGAQIQLMAERLKVVRRKPALELVKY